MTMMYYGKLVICLLELIYFVVHFQDVPSSINVKILLFKSYRLCLYGTALWRCYTTGTMNLKSAYNRCLKIFFGY